MANFFNTPPDQNNVQQQQSLNDVLALLLLATGMMISLLLSTIAVQADLISSRVLLWLFLAMLLASVVLVYRLAGFLKKYKALQARFDLINTGKDLVTGLPDTNEFILKVDIECRRCAREFVPLSIMYVGFDVDYLTEHDSIRVAENLINTVCRPGDMVAKVDETTFGLILPSTNEMARQLADRCLKGVMQLQIKHPVSIGLNTFQPTSELDCSVAMRSVQHLLTKAKAEGGNKVWADAQPPLDPPVTYSY
ncbi:GGDEF domain-containing protein [Neptunomonas sp.]|uniref:GGDEF domain-containing protein n=1 Tax=Neptunomonas sp. TaxID=1971898 RepID=UPI0035682A8C